jgi:hypothetical protein
MAQIKIQQKIPMKAFKGISDQLKAEGIHIISKGAFQRGEVKPDDIRGRVVSAFNLGAKIALDVQSSFSCSDSRFETLSGAFYLVTK